MIWRSGSERCKWTVRPWREAIGVGQVNERASPAKIVVWGRWQWVDRLFVFQTEEGRGIASPRRCDR